MKKRLLSLLLAASMVLGLCPASAFASHTGGGMLPDEVTAQNIEEQNADVSTTDVGQGLKFTPDGYPIGGPGENNAWYIDKYGDLYLQSGNYDFKPLGSMNIRCYIYFSTDTDNTDADNTVTFDGGNCNFIQCTRIHEINNVTIKGGTFTGLQISSDLPTTKTNVTIVGGTFNSYDSSSMSVNGRSPIVTVKGGVFNAPVEVSSNAKLIIPADSSAQFYGGITTYSSGTVTSEALIINSDGYPLGSNGGDTACSYNSGTTIGTLQWEYVPGTTASGAKGTLYIVGASTGLELSANTVVNCDIVLGTDSNGNVSNYLNSSTYPSLNGGTYNGTVRGLVNIKNGTFKNTVTAETDTSSISNGTFEGAVALNKGGTIHNGTFEKAVTLEYGGSITGGTFKSTVAMPECGKITNGTFEGAVTLNNSGSITDGTFSSSVTCNNGKISGGTFTETSNVAMAESDISGGIFRGRLSGGDHVQITGGLFLGDLSQSEHTSTGGYFVSQTFVHPSDGYSCGEICFVDKGGTFTLLDFPNEKLSYIYVVWQNGSETAATITPSQKITSVNLDTARTGTAGDEFTLSPSDFKGQGINTAVHMTTNEFHKVNLPENISLDAAVPAQSSGGTILGMAEIGQDHTITLPEGATIWFKDKNGTDAVFTAGSGALSKNRYGSYVYTVPGAESTVKRLNKLHIDANGLPITTGTYYEPVAGNGVVTAYYGDGWKYEVNTATKSHELTITVAQDLTNETNAITAPTIIKANVTGGTYNSSLVSCIDGGKLAGAALNGSVYANGTLNNCTISLTGSDMLTIGSDGSVQNCKITVSNHTSASGVSIHNIGQIGSGNTIDLGGTTLQNNGKLLLGGEGTAIKNGTIQNNGSLCSNGTVIEADVVNNGQIENSIITGRVTNGANGTITSSILTGEQSTLPENMHKLTITPAENVTVTLPGLDTISGFSGTAYLAKDQGFTVKTSIPSPIWTAEGITLDEDQLTASTLNLTMPTGDVTLSVAKKPGDFDPDDFIVTAPENAVEDGTVHEVVAVKRPDCEKAYGKISVIYRDAENNIVPAPTAAGVYSYTVIVADTAEFAGGTVATGSFEIAPAAEPGPGPEPSGDGDAGTGIALVVGGAALGGAVYLIGTQIWLETNLPGGVIPTSRQQLADLLWLTAGKPEPQSNVLFTDISAEAVDSQKAARWCTEQGLLNDKGESFQPGDYVFRPQVIKAWNEVQALQNQQ